MVQKNRMIDKKPLTFDLDVLRSFSLGVQLGSFAKAADRLARSTSAISAQLKKLEEQVGLPVLRKSGRGLELTPAGEVMLAYAQQLLALNDEAVASMQGINLQGNIRLGLQEDFAEHILAKALGNFIRAHPRIHVEVQIACNVQLLEQIGCQQLDLALAWDSETSRLHKESVATLPMSWIGNKETNSFVPEDQVPLVFLDAPCMMRTVAINALEQEGMGWWPALTSRSLAGVWAAVEAGLGVTVRTGLGLPKNFRLLENMPALPSIGLSLYRAEENPPPLVIHLAGILSETLSQALMELK